MMATAGFQRPHVRSQSIIPRAPRQLATQKFDMVVKCEEEWTARPPTVRPSSARQDAQANHQAG